MKALRRFSEVTQLIGDKTSNENRILSTKLSILHPFPHPHPTPSCCTVQTPAAFVHKTNPQILTMLSHPLCVPLSTQTCPPVEMSTIYNVLSTPLSSCQIMTHFLSITDCPQLPACTQPSHCRRSAGLGPRTSVTVLDGESLWQNLEIHPALAPGRGGRSFCREQRLPGSFCREPGQSGVEGEAMEQAVQTVSCLLSPLESGTQMKQI